MKKVEIAVVGAGPAGLSAAAQAVQLGAQVVVFDENARPGGQLFKQIHKFFGSKEHKAGVRGYDLGRELLEETHKLGAQIELNTVVCGLYADKRLAVIKNDSTHEIIQAENIILATGASENVLSFPGATLPGVMSAGAVQTMINIHRVLPAEKFIMVGSGNVGLIVSYQILQAGGKVAALVEAAPEIGGYGVHSAKISRGGVPILVRHTIKEAYGKDKVEGVIITALDDKWQMMKGTERDIKTGCVAIAVGLTPLAELAHLAGCAFTFEPRLGGLIPLHDDDMETNVRGIFVAGDISGVEEASSAMEEGRLAGVAAAYALGHISQRKAQELKTQIWARLNTLRTGKFGEMRRDLKQKIVEQGRVLIGR